MDDKDDDNSLSMRVAVVVAILATFMGICKVKDDNIVQAMQQAQASRIDDWSFYQARNIRQEIAQATLTQLGIVRGTAGPTQRLSLDSAITRYQALVKDQAAKKDSLRGYRIKSSAKRLRHFTAEFEPVPVECLVGA